MYIIHIAKPPLPLSLIHIGQPPFPFPQKVNKMLFYPFLYWGSNQWEGLLLKENFN